MEDAVLDVQGLSCPLPVLRAKKALRQVASGQTLTVLATDPASVKDFEVFCRTTGTELLDSAEAEGVYRFLLRKP